MNSNHPMKSIIKINEPKHQQFLRKLKLFRNLGDEELKLVKKCLTIIEVPKEGIVFERYSKEQVLYVIRYGKLKLESIGNETRLFEMGDFFGEIGLMNTNYRTGTVTALEPSLLFCLNGPDLIDESRIPRERH